MSPAKFLDLKDLTLKMTMLLALTCAQRGQTLHLLSTEFMEIRRSSVIFTIKEVIKNSRPGTGTPTLTFKAYAPDRRLCAVTYIKAYLQRTNHVRNSKEFFISH